VKGKCITGLTVFLRLYTWLNGLVWLFALTCHGDLFLRPCFCICAALGLNCVPPPTSVTVIAGKGKFAWQLVCLRAMNRATTVHASMCRYASACKSPDQLLTSSLVIYSVTIVRVHGERSLNALCAMKSRF